MKESRLFGILYYLLNHGRVSAKELSDTFEVSIRTIYRDIDVISASGIPIFTTQGRYGGIELGSEFILKHTLWSGKEKTDMLMALNSYNTLNGGIITNIIHKIEAQFKEKGVDWIQIDFSSWHPNANETFEIIKDAILSSSEVDFEYTGTYGKTQKRTIQPYRLIFKSQAWYVYGYCIDRKDFRIFKLYRMNNLKMTHTFTPILELPDVPIMKDPNWMEIKIYVYKDMLYRVYDDYKKEYIEELENGDAILSLKMPDESWIVNYWLSYGNGIKILEPQKLKTDYLEMLKKISQQY